MEVKICGLTKPVEAEYLNEAKADYAGFVFYEKSKRNVTPEQAKQIFKKLNPDIKKVAVTVSPHEEQLQLLQEVGFDILQVHGELSEEVLARVRLPVWYAFNIEQQEELSYKLQFLRELPGELSRKIAALAVDGAGYGGGSTFRWRRPQEEQKESGNTAGLRTLLGRAAEGRRLILAGGLTAGNVAEGIEIFQPDIVDVSSGVEGMHGKDRKLILDFIRNARAARSGESRTWSGKEEKE